MVQPEIDTFSDKSSDGDILLVNDGSHGCLIFFGKASEEAG